MDNKSSFIKERVLQIAEFKGVAKEKFIENLGQTYGNFKSKSKLTPVNSNFLEDLLSKYPEINPEWLLTGKGEMLNKKSGAVGNYSISEAERTLNNRINNIAFIFFKGDSTSFAKALDISEEEIKGYRSNIVPKIDFILKLQEVLKISPEWLLTGKNEMQVSEKKEIANLIPLIPIDAMAGKGNNGAVQISEKDIIDGYVIPDFTQRGVEYIIRVSGSSMYPKYSSGDLLGCKTVKDTSFFQWGKIYVLDTDQGPMVKRLFPSDKEGYLECRSDNKEYPPFLIHSESVYKVAIVVGVLRLE